MHQSTPFGHALRRWRALRRLSQLELALRAGTPARHVSFLETGRARPSQDMVQRLVEALDVPRDERNGLLLAAGFAPQYTQLPLSDDALAGVRAVIDRLLAAHAPFPGLVLNAWYDVLDLNASARAMLQLLGVSVSLEQESAPVVNLVELLVGSLRTVIGNPQEVLTDVQARLRSDLAHRVGDERLTALLAQVDAALATYGGASPLAEHSPILLTHFRTPAGELRTISALVHFGGARDLTVHGLHLELIYPADAATAAVFAGAPA